MPYSYYYANRYSHLRVSLQGPSLTVPFDKGELSLGTWQQVVLAEFDTSTAPNRVLKGLVTSAGSVSTLSVPWALA